MDAFHAKAEELAKSRKPEAERLRELRLLAPAERILELKVCDPAMGSGHFLVTLVDHLAIQVTTAMADAETTVSWAHYVSPPPHRTEDIRSRIYGNAPKSRVLKTKDGFIQGYSVVGREAHRSSRSSLTI